MSELWSELWRDLKRIYRGKILFIILFILLMFSFIYTRITEMNSIQNISSINVELLETQATYLKMSKIQIKERERINNELGGIKKDVLDIEFQLADISDYCQYRIDTLNEKINNIARLPRTTEITIFPGSISEFERKLYPKIENKDYLLFNDEKFKVDLRELNKEYGVETEKDIDALELKNKILWMKRYDRMIEKAKDGEYNIKTSWWQKIF